MDKLNSPVEQGVLALDVVVFAYHKGYCYDNDKGDKEHDEPFGIFVHLERIEEGVELRVASFLFTGCIRRVSRRRTSGRTSIYS